jgi:hypothetical protein
MPSGTSILSEKETDYLAYAISRLPKNEADLVIDDVTRTLEKIRAKIAAHGEPDEIVLSRDPSTHPLSGPIVTAILYRRGRSGKSYAAPT